MARVARITLEAVFGLAITAVLLSTSLGGDVVLGVAFALFLLPIPLTWELQARKMSLPNAISACYLLSAILWLVVAVTDSWFFLVMVAYGIFRSWAGRGAFDDDPSGEKQYWANRSAAATQIDQAIQIIGKRLYPLVAARLGIERPRVMGIAGAVAVGKSTVAQALAEEFEAAGRRVQIVATDAFLLSNATLAERDLTFRKGFPETYDLDALSNFLRAVRAGADQIEIPVYSHETYDLVPHASTRIEQPDLVIVEGVVVLQPTIAKLLDVSIYVDADEADVRRWFVERFLRLTEVAGNDPNSFYRGFVGMPADQLRSLAEATWDGINGVNLNEHILPTRDRAGIILEKSSDHSVRAITAT